MRETVPGEGTVSLWGKWTVGTDRSAILRHSQLSHFSSKTASLLMRGPVNHRTGSAVCRVTGRGFLALAQPEADQPFCPGAAGSCARSEKCFLFFFENMNHFSAFPS